MRKVESRLVSGYSYLRAMDYKKYLKISVLLADDHPGIISGVRHELSGESEIALNGSVSNSTDLIKKLEEGGFDVLVSDYSMPTGQYGDGLHLFGYISRRFPRLVIHCYHFCIANLNVGDALAMPVHCYYNIAALWQDFGVIRDYQVPKPHHPNSKRGGITYKTSTHLS